MLFLIKQKYWLKFVHSQNMLKILKPFVSQIDEDSIEDLGDQKR